MNKINLKVDGMSCGHCVASVEGALNKLGAVAKVDLTTKQVDIAYDSNKLTIEQMMIAIEDLGFDIMK